MSPTLINGGLISFAVVGVFNVEMSSFDAHH